MRNYHKYSDEDFIKYASEVKSIAGLLSKLGLRPAGGNYAHAKLNLQRLNVNTSHWTGQGWSTNQQLKDWNKYVKISSVKPHLIKKVGYKCNNCQLTEWQKLPIPLEVHHLDGNRCNNELTNLELLCCNCHALTHNWRNKKRVM